MKKLFLLCMLLLCIVYSHGMQKDNGQITSEKYSETSTYELLKMCIEYPRIIDVFAYDDIDKGFKKISSGFDGFEYLYNRKDILEATLEMFKEISSKLTEVSSAKEKGELYTNYMILTLIISQETIVNDLDEKEKEQLSVLKESTITEIMDYRGDLRNGNDTVHTPNQTPVSVISMVADYNEETRLFWDEFFTSHYSNAIYVGPTTMSYNCHTYAWYMRGDTTMVHYWMLDPLNYYSDYSYEETNDSTEAEIICYYEKDNNDVYDLTHSARRIGTGVYESKWGSGPLMIHSLTECPYSADSIVYFKRAYPSLSGSTIPSALSVYTINKIPSSFTINWSFTGTIPSGIMTGNNPSNTQCTINNSNSDYIKGTLRANIYNAGLYVTTLSKAIRTGVDFGATYSFNPDALIPIGNLVDDGDVISVYHHSVIVLQSQDFIDHTITYYGNGVQQFTNDGNGKITIHLSNVNSIIRVDGVLGYHHFRFYINVFNSLSLSESSLDISQEGNTCNIILNPEYDTEESNEIVSDQYTEERQEIAWDLQVVNAYTGEMIFKESVVGNSKSLDPSTWKSDVYIVKVRIDDQSVEKKIYVK